MISKNFIYGLRALLSRLAIAWLAFFGLALLLGSAMATNITGAGASLPYPVYAKWAAKYHQLTGKQVNYQSICSGGGQQQSRVGTVAVCASAGPMSAQARSPEQWVQ